MGQSRIKLFFREGVPGRAVVVVVLVLVLVVVGGGGGGCGLLFVIYCL